LNLAPGESKEASFTFNVGTTSATAHAFSSYRCIPDEGPIAGIVPWGDNDAGESYIVNPPPAWFETFGGDVGAKTDVTVNRANPAGRYNSQYLLAGDPTGSNTTYQGWRLNDYSQPQVAVSVYDYLGGRFRAKATTNVCLTDGVFVGLTTNSAFNYCTGDVPINNVTNVPVNSNYVWFIDGNLTINQNITIPSSSTVIFVVHGDIVIKTSVTRADGVYVSLGSFTDVDASGSLGSALTINGAVYATNNIILSRILTPAADNSANPADIINFQPKYIDALSGILGTPTISWQEVAP
jgi:hypothetical protein